MESILNQVVLNNNIIGLSIILTILGKLLKSIDKVPNYLILWILIGVSIFLSLLADFSVESLLEGFIAASLANTYYQTYKQTKEMFGEISNSKLKVN